MRQARRAGVAAALMAASAFAAGAQTAPAAGPGYSVGATDIGPTIGLGGIGAASFSIGGRFERGIKALPDMGDGVLALGISADWYNYNERFVGTDYDFTYIPIAATANYHFKMQNRKLDPFAGVGLGYMIVNTPYSGSFNSGLYFVGRLGLRYFVTPKMALYSDVGAGAAALNVGMTFRMSGS